MVTFFKVHALINEFNNMEVAPDTDLGNKL